MRTQLDSLLTFGALNTIRADKGRDLVNAHLEQQEYDIKHSRNVCAKVTPQLADNIDRVCQLLDIRKREFLEAAFISALHEADAVIQREGLEFSVFPDVEGKAE